MRKLILILSLIFIQFTSFSQTKIAIDGDTLRVSGSNSFIWYGHDIDSTQQADCHIYEDETTCDAIPSCIWLEQICVPNSVQRGAAADNACLIEEDSELNCSQLVSVGCEWYRDKCYKTLYHVHDSLGVKDTQVGFSSEDVYMVKDSDSKWTVFKADTLPSITRSNVMVTTCGSYTVPSGDETYSVSGIYSDTLTNSVSCDSIITIDLTIANINDESVSVSNSSFCDSGSTDVTIGGSESGYSYYLRNDLNDTIIDGPVAGTGSGLSFSTGTINETTSFNVYATQSNDQQSTGLSFDGIDDYLSISTVVPLTDFTNEFWFKTTEPTQGIFSVLDTDLGPAFDREIYLVNGNLEVYVYTPSFEYSATTGKNYADGEWHHVAHVVSQGSESGSKIYVDGELIISTTTINSSAFDWSTVVNIGFSNSAHVGTNKHFTGSIDEVRLWNVARSATEIQNGYHNCITGSETGLYVHLNFKDGMGSDTAADNSGNGNSATLMNMDPNSDWVTGAINSCASCTLEMSAVVTVSINNIDINLSTNGQMMFSNTDNATYQWLDCNDNYSPIAGETGQGIEANTSDYYAVEITKNGCIDTSYCVNGIITAFDNSHIETDVMIYPNPVQDLLSIDLGAENHAATILITNNSGELLKQVKNTNQQMIEIQISDLPAGSYFVKIDKGSGQRAVFPIQKL